eukprot:TRINITY_DN30988_c0_g1_i1.p1 TRINITY_DN30988_c0_g1~~TRINITY_DN30988_c0_g1_i1.p1  ORF type:complete len:129 (-),score=24.15 TRINITY_DN30988_c0_g1_i1:33-419(-)
MVTVPDRTSFTATQVAEHNSRNDCWIIINGKVYDVSRYLEEHPGGEDVLLAAAGKDGTDEFEDAGHSEDARKLMEDYYVGDIVNQECSKARKIAKATIRFSTKALPIAIPLAVVGLSAVVFYMKKKSK